MIYLSAWVKKIAYQKTAIILAILVASFLVAYSAKALIASPARLEIEGDPGQRVTSKLALVNNEDEPMTFFSSFENFEAQDETGVPYFVDSQDGLATWISAEKQVTLQPKERKEIPFTVDIPADAGVGGHFAAIFWGTTPPDAKSGEVAIGAKTGILIFLRVRGDIVEQGQIIELNTLDGKGFYDSLPVDMLYRFENQGNDRTKPIGEMTINNMFGKEVEKITANEKQGSVLPESVRKFYISWGRVDMDNIEKRFEDGTLNPQYTFWEKAKMQMSSFAFGRYSAVLNLTYGLQKNDAQSQISFWVIPWQLLSLVLLVLIVIVFGGKLMLRRYNKKIIARAQKEQNQKKNN